jgi:hypothetical protein
MWLYLGKAIAVSVVTTVARVLIFGSWKKKGK